MLKLRVVIVTLLLILSISLWGNTNAFDSKEKRNTAYPLSKETVQIQGFSQYPHTTFYHVYAKSVKRIIINQISGDAITLNPGGQGSIQYISWDTSLSSLQHGVELSGEDIPAIIQYVRLYRNDYKPRAFEVPFYSPCRKISHIKSYYNLSRSAQSGKKEYSPSLNKRVYSGGSEQITITNKFHEMQVIIEKLTHQPEKTPGYVLTNEEAKTIRAYADSLKTMDINKLSAFRKTPTVYQEDVNSQNQHKPHGILKLEVSGFENISDARFHLLIVGEEGITSKKIHGNSVRLVLQSDENAFVSISQYWKKEKQGILFDTKSKEYKHYKASLHPKNRNDEPLVEIPTYLIDNEKTSEVYQFVVVRQLPELAKTKDEFVIKLKENNGWDKRNYHIVLIELFQGYRHINKLSFAHWMQYLFFFLGVFLLSLVIKYLVMYVLFKPVCHASGKDNYKIILSACASGIAISLTVIWWILPLFIHQLTVQLIISIAFSVVVEGFIYSKILHISLMKAMLLSIMCNLVFFSAGLLIF